MAHPDTPPAKRRANRLPSGGAGHGPASGIPAGGMGWGGAASGNPASPWPKGVVQPHTGKSATIRERLEPHVQTAIETMVAIMSDPNHPQARAAAQDVLDRVFGKAVQPTVTADLNKPAADASTEALMAAARRELGIEIEGEVE